jgi:tripartite-type tricarboxylate transporter receptor subunit TctC
MVATTADARADAPAGVNQQIEKIGSDTMANPGRRVVQGRLWHLALAALAVWIGAAPLHAQIGEQPIRIIFPFAAGGSGDGLARLIADKMRGSLNRPVIVEDRAGAAGRIGVNDVKNAAPDGTTLLLTPIAPMSLYQHVYAKLDYDPIKDFAALSQLGTFDFGIAVGPQADVKTLKELVDWAKANPKEANYAVPAAGTLPHFLGVLLGREAKIDLRDVPYHGSAAGLTDVVAGHIPIIVTTTSDLVQMHRAGRIRVLATSDKSRSPFLPEVPTFREAGYDLIATGWYGIFAPAKTPPDVIARLNTAIVDAVRSADVKERLLAFGLQPTGTSAAEFAKIVQADSDLWAPAVKASGFTPED